jgi:hypothetical protein
MPNFYEMDLLESMLSGHGILNEPLIRPVRNLGELQSVYRLTHDCYVTSGYCASHPSGMVLHYPYFDHIPETTILVALLHGKIVGSVSFTVDGPNGFTVEEQFKSECGALRAEGRPIATVWRLVVDQSARTRRSIVMNLIDEVTRQILKTNTQTFLFSVNPKHENIYKRMMDMEIVGRKAGTEGLCNAPAVLLRGDAEKVRLHRTREQPASEHFNPIHSLLLASNF